MIRGLFPRVNTSSGVVTGVGVGGTAVGRKLKLWAGSGVRVGVGGRRVIVTCGVGESSIVAVGVSVGVGGIRVVVLVGVTVGVGVVAR